MIPKEITMWYFQRFLDSVQHVDTKQGIKNHSLIISKTYLLENTLVYGERLGNPTP